MGQFPVMRASRLLKDHDEMRKGHRDVATLIAARLAWTIVQRAMNGAMFVRQEHMALAGTSTWLKKRLGTVAGNVAGCV